MEKKQKENRVLYLDILRIMSILGVIVIHVTGEYVVKIKNIDTTGWWIENIFNSMSRFAVPVFFMISGVLLLNRDDDESFIDFLKKRLVKIGIPFLIWSVCYSILKHYLFMPDNTPPLLLVREIAADILFDKAASHLWFIYMIGGIYLVTPFVRKLIKNSSLSELGYVLIIWFVSTIFYTTIRHIYGFINPAGYLSIRMLDIPLFSGLIGYFIAGYYLHKIKVPKYATYAIYALTLVSFIAIPILIYLSNVGGTSLNENFYNHFALTTCIISVGTFLGVKNINWEKILPKQVKTGIISLSNATLGIYFVHIIVQLLIVHRFFRLPAEAHNLIRIVCYSFLTLGISFLIVKLIKLHTPLKKLLVS